ncbi:EF-hand domain-containing protein [Plasmodiophora brassicae]
MLQWGPVNDNNTPESPLHVRSLAKAVVVVPDGGAAPHLAMAVPAAANLADGERTRLSEQKRVPVTDRPPPTKRHRLRLPRPNSAELARKMDAFVRPEGRVPDELIPGRTHGSRSSRHLPLTREKAQAQRREVVTLSTWFEKKLAMANDIKDDGDRDKFIASVLETALSDLIRQVTAHTSERGTLLADLCTQERRVRQRIMDRAMRQELDSARTEYRARLLAISSQQQADAAVLADERLRIWQECEELRGHLVQREQMLSTMQTQMEEEVSKRDDALKVQQRAARQMEVALEDLSVKLADLMDGRTAMQRALQAANETIAQRDLDLKFAREWQAKVDAKPTPGSRKLSRLQSIKVQDLPTVPDEEGAQAAIESILRPGVDIETAASAAIRIQRLVRGNLSRRKTEQGSEAMAQSTKAPEPAAAAETGEVPEPLRRLFQCAPEVHASHFRQEIPRAKLLKWTNQVMLVKGDYDWHYARRGLVPLSFPEVVYDYYLSQHSLRDSAELDLMDLAYNLNRYRADSARIRMFLRFVSGPAPQRVVDAALTVHEALRLYAAGPFDCIVDNCQGVCWVDVDTVCDVVSRLLHQFDSEALDGLQRNLRARSKVLSVARSFTSPTTTAYKGTDQFMDLDDCIEIIWDALRAEDDRLSSELQAALHQHAVKYVDGRSDVVLTLNDFEVVIHQIDINVTDLHILQMYREAGNAARGRPITIADLRVAARSLGILPIPLDVSEFPRLMAYRIQRGDDIVMKHRHEPSQDAVGRADSVSDAGSSERSSRKGKDGAEDVALMQKKLAAMREKVVDTGNAWKAKLERMQEKYDLVASKLRQEYEAKLDTLAEQEKTATEEHIAALVATHNAKLQLCFEKFEQKRSLMEKAADDLKQKLREVQSEFRKMANEWSSEKEHLYAAIDSLTTKLSSEVDNAAAMTRVVRARTADALGTLAKSTDVMSRQLHQATLAMERSRMSEEDMRTRMVAQAVRLANEATLLRRGKQGTTLTSIRDQATTTPTTTTTTRLPGRSRQGSQPQTPMMSRMSSLVSSVPPISSVEFDGGAAGSSDVPSRSQSRRISIDSDNVAGGAQPPVNE